MLKTKLPFKEIKKRDGRIVDFEPGKIKKAIYKAITATGQGDGKESKKLSEKVIRILKRRFKKGEIPTVEQVQDIVEEVLILAGLVKTAKAYILYREQRRRIREEKQAAEEAVDRVDDYLQQLDWEVKENANMAFSLQGLNRYTVSYVIKKYWLNKIYPPEIRKANQQGLFHLHDLDTLGCYCMGWDLFDLLIKGFGGVKGKVESKPPKHLRSALGQAVNFLYTLQGECYSEDTQVLTEEGWKYFYQLSDQDKIVTLNPETDRIELQKPLRFYEFDDRNLLYNFKSKKIDLLVTPGHRMLVDQYCPDCKQRYHRKFVTAENFNPNTNFIPKQGIWEGEEQEYFELPEINIFQCRNYSSPASDVNASAKEQEVYGKVISSSQTQVLTSQPRYRYDIETRTSKKIPMDDWLAFFGFWMAEGCTSLRERHSKGRNQPYYQYAVRIFQSKGKTAQDFEQVLQRLPFNYNKKERAGSNKLEFVIYDKQLYSYLEKFGKAGDKFIPQNIKSLSKRQLKILFQWMMRGDGYKENGNVEYYTKSKKLADDVQELVLKLGLSANIYKKTKGQHHWYKVGISRAKHFRFTSPEKNIKKVSYSGKVYCVDVPNHTLYVRRKGKACWCGNCAGAVAFSNFDTLMAPFIRYDGLSSKQVKQAVQEFLYNMAIPTRVGFQSLAWDELIVIKHKGRIQFREIGKLVDEEFDKHSHRIIEKNQKSYAIKNHDDYYTLSFNSEGKAVLAKVKAFIRHKVPKDSQFLKIRTNRGESLVSPGHSLFAFKQFNNKFNPQSVSASDVEVASDYRHLSPNNHFLALGKLQAVDTKEELDLVSLIEAIPQLQKNVFVRINPTRTLSKIRENIIEEYQAIHPFYVDFGIRDKGVWKDWLERKSVRYDVWRKFGDGSKNVELTLKNSNIWYPRILKGEILQNFIKLCAWYIGEGHRGMSVPFYVSQANLKNKKGILEILKNLNSLGHIEEQQGYSAKGNKTRKVYKITAKGLLSEIISLTSGVLSFNKVIPWYIFDLTKPFQEMFIKVLLKGEASEYGNYWDLCTTSKKLSLSLSILLSLNDIRFNVYTEHTRNENWRDRCILRIYKNPAQQGRKEYRVGEFEARVCLSKQRVRYNKEFEYDISVDLPQENFVGGTGALVFHNSPFSNITLDLKPSGVFADKPVIIGGQVQGEIYGDFEEEMRMFDKAFYEVMLAGDKTGRPFHFPIPTINITKDFPWNDPAFDIIFEASAKYGTNYFANYINSDMSPDDARSMCFPATTRVIYKTTENGIPRRSTVRHIVNRWEPNKNFYLLMSGEWVKITDAFKLENAIGKIVKVTLKNGETIRMTPDHPAMVVKDGALSQVKAKKLKKGDVIPVAKGGYKGKLGDFDLGRWLGLYVAEGGITESTVYFSFHEQEKNLISFVREIAEQRFAFPTRVTVDPRWQTCQVWIKSKAAVEWVKKFCQGGNALEKRLLSSCFGMSDDFRQGVIVGIYQGDGYERDMEFHTTNRKLRNDVAELAQSIGMNYTKRTNTKNSKEGRHFTSYVLRLCRDSLEQIASYFKRIKVSRSSLFKDFGGFSGIKIDSIEVQNYHSPVYDFEVNSKEHLFQLANGVITHNCCRLRLDLNELHNRGGGGLFGSGSLTGSIGVVTANLPRIAYTSKTRKDFFGKLTRAMDLAKESLDIKRKVLENYVEKGLYPYSKFYLDGIKQSKGAYYANHFSTIGLIGMNEALLNFLGEDIGSKIGLKFALEVMDFMRDRLLKYQKETGQMYNLEATPAEGSLSPQEKVLIAQSDPRLAEIGSLIDEYIEKNKNQIKMIGNSEVLPLAKDEMFTYGFSRRTQKISKYPVTALVRHPGESMYEIVTVSGRKVRVTGQHSVFTLSGEGAVQEIRISDLKEKEIIAIPKKIEIEEQYSEFNLIEEFRQNHYFKDKLYLKATSQVIENLIDNDKVKKWAGDYYGAAWKDVKCWWRKKRTVPLKMVYDLDLFFNREESENSLISYRKSKSTYPIKALIKCHRNLGLIFGLLLAEGWVDTDRMEITNTDLNLLKTASLACQQVFGKKSCYLSKGKERKGREKLYTLVLNKMTTLAIKEFSNIKGKSHQKSIPSFAYFTSKEFVAGLLKGFCLGDGSEYFNQEKSDYTYRLYTSSKELMEGLNILLLRIGILAKIRIEQRNKDNPNWRKSYVLSISGVDNLNKFYTLVFEKGFKIKLKNSGGEVIPKIMETVKFLVKKHGLNTRRLKKLGIDKDSFNRNVRKNRISLHYLKNILAKLGKRIQDPLLNNLKLIARSDLYWDAIKSVKKVKIPKYVYDLEVDVEGDLVNNFLGGQGLVSLHNTSYRLAKKDKDQFPDIITAGTKGKPYYTNSTHLSVNYTDDPFRALELQDELQTKYSGGTVLHLFLGERLPNAEAAKKLVKKVFENFNLPYISLTPTFSVCPKHGYLSGEHFICPKCVIDQPCEVYSRIVGYYRPVQQWNKGKQQEFKERKAYKP